MAPTHLRLFLQGVAAALLSLSSVQPTRAQATPEPIRFATDTVFVRDEAGAAQAAGAASVADLLTSRAPWLLVTRPSGSVGEAVGLSLRDPSPGAPPVAVYVDGVRLDALPLPALTLRTPDPLLEIDPEAVERIELVRGAVASARWGSDAAGGVLLVTTRRPRDGGMRQSVSGTLGAVTPGPRYGRVWRTCTEADPVVECSGRAEGEVVSVDGLAQSGLVESRMLHALRWSGAYARGPFSAAASLTSEDRPGAFAGEGFERRIGSVDLGLALHRSLRLDLWGVLADVEPGLERDVQSDITCLSISWPTVAEGGLQCGSAAPLGEGDLDARRFSARVAHAPRPWLMHRVTASGHAGREIATRGYSEGSRERGEIGRWQGAWEYEVRGVRPSQGARRVVLRGRGRSAQRAWRPRGAPHGRLASDPWFEGLQVVQVLALARPKRGGGCLAESRPPGRRAHVRGR